MARASMMAGATVSTAQYTTLYRRGRLCIIPAGGRIRWTPDAVYPCRVQRMTNLDIIKT